MRNQLAMIKECLSALTREMKIILTGVVIVSYGTVVLSTVWVSILALVASLLILTLVWAGLILHHSRLPKSLR